jgi:acetyl/propionyl-CoA carboxylase alpha subunit
MKPRHIEIQVIEILMEKTCHLSDEDCFQCKRPETTEET